MTAGKIIGRQGTVITEVKSDKVNKDLTHAAYKTWH